MEETGVKITNPRFFHATNDIMKNDDTHYITIYMRGDYAEGEACITEPEKFVEVGWYDLNNLPSPRFSPLDNLLKDIQLS